MPIEAVSSINEPIEAVATSEINLFGEGFVEAGQVSVPAGATEVTITFKVQQADLNYQFDPEWFNKDDASPQFQDMVVSAKTLIDATIKWNAPTDSANYKIDYSIIRHNP